MITNPVLVLITDGTEEMEATITVDVLRRAQLSVVIAGISLKELEYAVCSRGVKIIPDILLDNESATWNEVILVACRLGGEIIFRHTDPHSSSPPSQSDFDAIVIPGGMDGARTLAGDARVLKLLSNQEKQGKITGFICAGTLAAKAAGVGLGGKVTSHPSVKGELVNDYEYIDDDRVVVANKVITSRGPGTTFAFALMIVEQLLGKQVSGMGEKFDWLSCFAIHVAPSCFPGSPDRRRTHDVATHLVIWRKLWWMKRMNEWCQCIGVKEDEC
ncbi:LOW QUALITY PROTEIN: class I glutamine amidotransferase-like protein [Jimgerdemannia flammicorona]|uniref:D-lactate dehydratase n=1 Tax=Jimgerdemannia flammicorona TaxID=994334 RepID=A0A433B2H5_9FUNG|nr:LOW QUALITY PROTEIN: class I glutamine amidotransferase-like protein [Jimgerdemannia flammicorona]